MKIGKKESKPSDGAKEWRNKGGRPKGSESVFTMGQLHLALKKVGEDERKDIFQHFVERAYLNDRVLICLINKLLPDAKPVAPEDQDTKRMLEEQIEFSTDRDMQSGKRNEAKIKALRRFLEG